MVHFSSLDYYYVSSKIQVGIFCCLFIVCLDLKHDRVFVLLFFYIFYVLASSIVIDFVLASGGLWFRYALTFILSLGILWSLFLLYMKYIFSSELRCDSV